MRLVWGPLIAVAVGAVACSSGDTVDPGFNQVSGAGGASGSGGSGHSSSSASVSASSTVSSSTSTSTAASAGHSSSASGTPCPDSGSGEPNDTESTAVDLGTINDCDGSGSSVMGTIAGPADVDWYKYAGNDTFGCVVDATRSLTSDAALRICKFVQCLSGNPEFGCPAGTAPVSSPDGRPGCCGWDAFSIGPNCAGVDDNTLIYIRIDNPNAEVCVNYTLAYHY